MSSVRLQNSFNLRLDSLAWFNQASKKCMRPSLCLCSFARIMEEPIVRSLPFFEGL